jgi:hypothetical protein
VLFRSKEGRRLEAVPGGWRVLNYLEYREKGQEKAGSRARYFRGRRAMLRATPECSAQQAPVACNTEAEDRRQTTELPHPLPLPFAAPDGAPGASPTEERAEAVPDDWPEDWNRQIVDLWRPYGEIAAGRLCTRIGELRPRWRWCQVSAGLSVFLREGKAALGPEVFTRSIADWLVGGGGRRAPPRRPGDGCDVAARPMADELVERIERRKRIAATLPRTAGESNEARIARINAALEMGQ